MWPKLLACFQVVVCLWFVRGSQVVVCLLSVKFVFCLLFVCCRFVVRLVFVRYCLLQMSR